ncbi:MAG: fibrobacter succinogenes major paralogous domain-containing protein [Prevotellaceae bacterium]|jgi:uncharacterized protein (TIGR02145 family)|nr:fibrobacter succinogenes major paralogous domain-containing protein [Prevotellaceae bacterium]
MKTNLFLFAALVAAFLSVASFSAAQVTIGGTNPPAVGAILDLNSTTKGGLALSNVELTSLTAIPATFPNAGAIVSENDKQALAGMIVWNTNDLLAPNGDGLYLWDGSKWNYCGGSDGVDILTGGGIPTGSGTLFGKTIFDIAKSNGSNGSSCGLLAERLKQQTDFTSQNGVQYTFTPSGTVNNVRFGFIEAVGAGKIVESIMPVTDYSGNVSSAQVTVNYKSSLQNDLLGLTRDKGLKLKLYAIYNDGNADRSVELNISLQDCACCGAYTASGVWKVFMCHNLGANEGADPFTPSAEIHGAKYKWGSKTVALTQADDQANSGGITSPTAWADLSVDLTNNNWQSSNNPCPPGWRVPTREEWEAVINISYNPTITKVGPWLTTGDDSYRSGMQVGDALFLPAAGHRGNSGGALSYRGSRGYYWSSTAASDGYNLRFLSDSQSVYAINRSYGFPVRCISE